MKKIKLTYLLLLLSTLSTFAVPAFRGVMVITQPDGTPLSVLRHGDESFSYTTTEDGFVVQQNELGFYEYAAMDVWGAAIRTRGVVAKNSYNRSSKEKRFLKKSMTFGTRISDIVVPNRRRSVVSQKSYPLSGNPKSLVILAEFTNKKFSVTNPQQAYTALLNQAGYSTNGGTGSARDYFSDNSNGVFAPDFIVVGPVSLDQTYNYYGQNINGSDANPRQMIIDACKKADTLGIDFTEYDTDGDGQIFEFATINKMNGMASYTWKLGNTYTPDNFLVTPGLEMGVDMRLDYVIYPQSKATKYAEKFAIVISADSITAENCRDAVCLDSLRFPASYRVDSIRSVIHTIAIPREFENKKVWMAIRHFDVTNKSALFIEKLKIY